MLVCVLSAAALATAENPGVQRTAFRNTVKRGPNIHSEIPNYLVNRQLPRAFRDALKRIKGLESCRGLFERLEADGLEVLADTTYVYAEVGSFKSVCDEACAFTTVGGSMVGLCAQFGRIPVDEAAQVLIHEALHNAGLTEQPHDPAGLTPAEIDTMVEHACGF
jgi:hypothetical protein